MKRGMAVAGLIVVTAIWGGGFVASDIALNSLTPMQIMAIRFLLGAVLMSFISVREFRNINLKEIGAGVLMGIALFAAFALQIIGLQYTTPSKNAFLTRIECGDGAVHRLPGAAQTRRMAWRTGGLLVRCRRGGAFVERQYDARFGRRTVTAVRGWLCLPNLLHRSVRAAVPCDGSQLRADGHRIRAVCGCDGGYGPGASDADDRRMVECAVPRRGQYHHLLSVADPPASSISTRPKPRSSCQWSPCSAHCSPFCC